MFLTLPVSLLVRAVRAEDDEAGLGGGVLRPVQERLVVGLIKEKAKKILDKIYDHLIYISKNL